MLAVKITSMTADGTVTTNIFPAEKLTYSKHTFNAEGSENRPDETFTQFMERQGNPESFPVIEKDNPQPMEYAVLYLSNMPNYPLFIFPKSSCYIMLDGVTVDAIHCNYL